MVTIIEPEVNKAVSGAISMLDVLQVTVGSLVDSVGTQQRENGHLFVDIPSGSSTEVGNGTCVRKVLYFVVV